MINFAIINFLIITNIIEFKPKSTWKQQEMLVNRFHSFCIFVRKLISVAMCWAIIGVKFDVIMFSHLKSTVWILTIFLDREHGLNELIR